MVADRGGAEKSGHAGQLYFDPVGLVVVEFAFYSSEPDQPTLIARTSAARSSTGIVGSSPGLFTGRLRM